jgi:hypothetical protein
MTSSSPGIGSPSLCHLAEAIIYVLFCEVFKLYCVAMEYEKR